MNFFRKQIKNKIKYNLSKTLKSALVQILHDTKIVMRKIALYYLVQPQLRMINI